MVVVLGRKARYCTPLESYIRGHRMAQHNTRTTRPVSIDRLLMMPLPVFLSCLKAVQHIDRQLPGYPEWARWRDQQGFLQPAGKL